jgi:hypothetical protein
LSNHKRNFERWRKRLPANTGYRVAQVLARIVPAFEAKGFGWYPDFAGGDPVQIAANEIPLQRRKGAEWPTVQLAFHKHGRPWFQIHFAALPEVCRRLNGAGHYVSVARKNAIAVEGPAYFGLRRGRWGDYQDAQFGFDWLTMFPVPVGLARFIRYRLATYSYLDSEIDAALALLPDLFHIFDQGIPGDWLEHGFGYVTPHVMLVHSWKLWEEHRKRQLPAREA